MGQIPLELRSKMLLTAINNFRVHDAKLKQFSDSFNDTYRNWRKTRNLLENDCKTLFKAGIQIFLDDNNIIANIRSEFDPTSKITSGNGLFRMTTIYTTGFKNKISVDLNLQNKAFIVSQKCTDNPKFMEPVITNFREFYQSYWDIFQEEYNKIK